jgi:hypothetical protein
MSTVTKELLQNLRVDLDKAIADVGGKHNVALRVGNASYTPSAGTATFKLEVTTLADGGKQRDIPAELFLQYADIIGLKKEYLHKEITLQGRKFKVSGYKPKARKNSICIFDSTTNKTFVTSVDTVKRQLTK